MKVSWYHLCSAALLPLLLSNSGFTQTAKPASDSHQGGHAQAMYHGGLVTPPGRHFGVLLRVAEVAARGVDGTLTVRSAPL